MDDPAANPVLVVRTLTDVAAANRFLGGSRAVMRELAAFMGTVNESMSMIDVGTGIGDIPAEAARAARRRGVHLDTYGVDSSEASLRGRIHNVVTPVRGDARVLPFRDDAFDVAMCSQVLHHFSNEDAPDLLRELNRVARALVIVSDIRRSAIAAAGIWIASFPLRFHPVSRHDGVVSVLRGFTTGELRSMVRESVGVEPRVRRHPGFRLTASWRPRRTRNER